MRIFLKVRFLLFVAWLGLVLSGCAPSNPPPSTNTDPYSGGSGSHNTDPYSGGNTGSGNTDPYGSGNPKPGNTDPYGSGSSGSGNTDPYSSGNSGSGNTDPYAGGNSNSGNTDPYSNYKTININTASALELAKLPGIGPVLANEIVNYRFFYGPFSTPSDLIKVKGIGQGKYDAIRGMVSASGGTSSYYHPPSPPPDSWDPYSSTDPYSSGTSGKLNINIATQAELEKLPGIGPAKARAIIDYRTTYGKFQTKEEVQRVSGIGQATYDQISTYIVARGGATSGSELELAYNKYQTAYKKYISSTTDPYATYSDKRLAYDNYDAAKKEYERLKGKLGN